MKVILRKSVDWFGPYQLLSPLEKLLEKVVKKYNLDEDLPFEIVSWIVDKIPREPFNNTHEFRKKLPWNKDIIKIHPWDTWSMDYTLAQIVVPMLKQLKETKHGVPCEFAHVGGEEYSSQLCFDFYSKDAGQLFDKHAEKRWNEVLDKMIWSFDQILIDANANVYWEPYWEDMDESEVVPDNNIWERMGEKHPRKKVNEFKREEYYAKLNEGFELFGKYYRNLWD